jgi:hypothetical protein
MSIKTLCTPSRFLVAPGLPAQIIPDSVPTIVNMPTLHFDALDEFNLVTSMFTPKRAGYYLLNAHLQFIAGGGAYATILYIGNIGVPVAMEVATPVNAGAFVTTHGSIIVYCTPNDNWYIAIFQNSGGNKTINPTNNITYFTGHRLS